MAIVARREVEGSAGMVRQVMPGWSWEEDFDAPQRARLARRIVAELDARLRATPGTTLYAATVHPVLSRHLREAVDETAGGAENLWKVARPKRSDAYATSDPALFTRILPVLFEFGPPEISILAVTLATNAMPDGLGDVITGIVGRPDGAGPGAVRMDFDSGYLLRIA